MKFLKFFLFQISKKLSSVHFLPSITSLSTHLRHSCKKCFISFMRNDVQQSACTVVGEWMIIYCSCVCEKCAMMMEELFFVTSKINMKILIYLIFSLTPGLETSWWSFWGFTWWSQLTVIIGSAVGGTLGKWFLVKLYETEILLILLSSYLF